MILFNRTKNVEVCRNVAKASLFNEKQKGLIGSNGEEALFFETRWGIHTFDMSFDINVAVLDNKNIIVKLRKNMKPNGFFFWNPKYNKVIEIPSQLKNSDMFDMGDEILLIDQ